MKDRVFGIETEYALIFHPRGLAGARPTNLELYRRFEAALLAREHGVRVHAIGLGEPRKAGKASPGEGLDEPALQEIAARTGGHYFRAGDANALERIYETLGRSEPALRDTRRFRPAAELYAWPLAAALLCALAALLVAWREERQ